MRQADDEILDGPAHAVVPNSLSPRYSFASFSIASLALAWFLCPVLIFSPQKQDSVGQMGSVLAVLLGVTGYKSGRKLGLAKAGFVIGALAFLLNTFLVTL